MKKIDSVKRVNSLTEPCARRRFNGIIDDAEVSGICERILQAMAEYRKAQKRRDTQAYQERADNYAFRSILHRIFSTVLAL